METCGNKVCELGPSDNCPTLQQQVLNLLACQFFKSNQSFQTVNIWLKALPQSTKGYFYTRLPNVRIIPAQCSYHSGTVKSSFVLVDNIKNAESGKKVAFY